MAVESTRLELRNSANWFISSVGSAFDSAIVVQNVGRKQQRLTEA